jgi:hypothetical protein
MFLEISFSHEVVAALRLIIPDSILIVIMIPLRFYVVVCQMCAIAAPGPFGGITGTNNIILYTLITPTTFVNG